MIKMHLTLSREIYKNNFNNALNCIIENKKLENPTLKLTDYLVTNEHEDYFVKDKYFVYLEFSN